MDKTITSRDHNGIIQLWDSVTGQPKESPVISNLAYATINSNGTMLAGVYSSSKISLWDIATEISVASLEGHTSSIYALEFSPDGEFLVSGGKRSDYSFMGFINLCHHITCNY